MPELPEVETVKEVLKKKILNKIIKDVKVYWANIIEYPSKDEFISKIKGQTIKDINRRGKWLMFELDNYYLFCHLRMEGKFYLKNHNDTLEKHEHIVFDLDDIELRYKDTRKFGKMLLISKQDVKECKPLKDLGLEPFDDQLTTTYLKNKFKNKTLSIKSLLLDQSIIAGIGNIYADEILFASHIKPSKIGNKLSIKELQDIIDNTKIILKNAIKKGGTTIRTYTSSLGVTGEYQHDLFVHQRKGKECKICGNIIKKTTVGTRGTYYCSKCQK
jgi:formamidopyrimidine-DNA glycosylase